MGMTYTAEYMHVICCEAVAKQTMDYSVCVCYYIQEVSL